MGIQHKNLTLVRQKIIWTINPLAGMLDEDFS